MIRPSISLRHNLISLPGGAHKNTALYDMDGRRVDDTNITVTAPGHIIFAKEYARAPERIEVPAELDVIDEQVLYIGVARNHYGHFLLDSMSRMWAALDTKMPCVFLGTSDVEGQGEYYDRIMEVMDLTVISPNRPTLYRNIWVPSTTMTNNEIRREGDIVHLRVTERLHKEHTGKWEQPVFLSRKGFPTRSRIAPTVEGDEARLERLMEEGGYRIVHPERFPFADQIALFNECPKIVGLLGSAFHTAFFSRRSYKGKLALLTFRIEEKKGRYGLIDAIKGYSASYIQCAMLDPEAKVMRIDVEKAIHRLEELEFLQPGFSDDFDLSARSLNT